MSNKIVIMRPMDGFCWSTGCGVGPWVIHYEASTAEELSPKVRTAVCMVDAAGGVLPGVGARQEFLSEDRVGVDRYYYLNQQWMDYHAVLNNEGGGR
jgi:hypothetical protein